MSSPKNKNTICTEICKAGEPVWLLGVKYNVHLGQNSSLSASSSSILNTSQTSGTMLVKRDEELGVELISIVDQSEQASKIGHLLLEDFESLMWFSYRRDFAPIHGSTAEQESYWAKMGKAFSSTAFTSDAGWGCMMRTGQMLLAHALIVNYLGRDWRLPQNSTSKSELGDSTTKGKKKKHKTKKLISLHSSGESAREDELKTLNTKDGDLIVPSSSSHLPANYHMILEFFLDKPECPFSIHNIVHSGTMFGRKVGEWFSPSTIALVIQKLVSRHLTDVVAYVADQACICIDEVLQLASASTPLTSSSISITSSSSELPLTWKPVIILIPLRLGLDNMNPGYIPSLKKMFELNQSLGIVGGKPKHSLYFVGYQGQEVLYLDPHIVQKASNDYTSFHQNTPKKIKFTEMDPSMCLGFFCKTRKDFEELIAFSKPNFASGTFAILSIIEQKKRVTTMPTVVPTVNYEQSLDEEDDDLVIIDE